VQEYLRAGTRFVWVVRPRTRSITVYQRDEPEHVYAADAEIDAGNVLPGFRAAVSDLLG
jgi:Uma2 family endonuclease